VEKTATERGWFLANTRIKGGRRNKHCTEAHRDETLSSQEKRETPQSRGKLLWGKTTVEKQSKRPGFKKRKKSTSCNLKSGLRRGGGGNNLGEGVEFGVGGESNASGEKKAFG